MLIALWTLLLVKFVLVHYSAGVVTTNAQRNRSNFETKNKGAVAGERVQQGSNSE